MTNGAVANAGPPSSTTLADLRERGALFSTWPGLEAALPWRRLGNWPSPLEAHRLEPIGGRPFEVLVKREDLSADGYAGNKIRPLEVVFGAMARAGLHELWSTGAYGSNHALAAAVHAKRLGLRSGAVLWPQPWSQTAHDNLVATLAVTDEVRFVSSVAHMVPEALLVRRTRPAWVMPPGAATPLGALGHAGAALELGHQLVAMGDRVDTIVLPIGSTCTTVGLLVGTELAFAAGLLPKRPAIVAVRVTPWPVTDTRRIVWMAARTERLLRRYFDEVGLACPIPRRGLLSAARAFDTRLEVVGDELGPGYGVPTAGGWRAIATFLHERIRLDTTYSAKAASHLLIRGERSRERMVFWSTKSALPLPTADALPRPTPPIADLAARTWLESGPQA